MHLAALLLAMAISAGGEPPTDSACFGAAARDPARPCSDPRLLRSVVPSPAQARKLPNSPCAPVERRAAMNVCGFGADPGVATRTVALVGDSHAGHWRAALDVVARARGWRGLSIAHTGCPLSKAVRNLPEPGRFRACVAWKRAVFAWFERHPEVGTVFVGGLSGGTGVIAPRGQSRFAASVRGYRRAWAALPPTVTAHRGHPRHAEDARRHRRLRRARARERPATGRELRGAAARGAGPRPDGGRGGGDALRSCPDGQADGVLLRFVGAATR